MKRRSVLVGSVTLFAGCPGGRSRGDVDPAAHVTDWHEEPDRGLADPITIERNTSKEEDCGTLALSALESRIDARIDDLTGISHGLSNGNGTDAEARLEVIRTLHVTEGKVSSKPTVSFSALREVIPRTIRVGRQSGKTEERCQWPVYVSDEVAYKP